MGEREKRAAIDSASGLWHVSYEPRCRLAGAMKIEKEGTPRPDLLVCRHP